MQLPEYTASVPHNSNPVNGQWNSCNALPHCRAAEGRATPTMHCHTACGRSAVDLVQFAGPLAGGIGSPTREAVAASIAVLSQCTTTLPRGSWTCNSCNALPYCLGAVGSRTPVMHCHTAYGRLVVSLLQCTAQ